MSRQIMDLNDGFESFRVNFDSLSDFCQQEAQSRREDHALVISSISTLTSVIDGLTRVVGKYKLCYT